MEAWLHDAANGLWREIPRGAGNWHSAGHWTHIEDVKIGDEVILLGEENGLKFDANDMAEVMGTINYEILCMISHRVPRIYKKNNEIVKVRNYI